MATIRKHYPPESGDKTGFVVAESQNLAGVLNYARKYGIQSVNVLCRVNGEATANFNFQDGAFSNVHFASYSVAIEFVEKRRSWALFKTFSDSAETNFVAGQ